LEVWQTIQAQRQRIWKYYDQHLRDWAQERGIGCPVVPAHCEQSYHMYYLIMPSLETRQALISFLKSRGILSVFHYVPLHLSPMGQRMGGRNGGCPVSEQKSERLVRLPFYNSLSQGAQDQVIAAVRQFQL
jgi:dTDP-4-amino-4,6-dideoxygalactose transaminase